MKSSKVTWLFPERSNFVKRRSPHSPYVRCTGSGKNLRNVCRSIASPPDLLAKSRNSLLRKRSSREETAWDLHLLIGASI